MQNDSNDIAERGTRAILWRSVAMAAVLGVELVRSILLARMLPIEIFGIYAFAAAMINFSGILPRFGTDSALLYHQNVSDQDVAEAAAVHFSFRLLLTSFWVLLATAAALLFTDGVLQIALLALVLANAGLQLADTARVLLLRHIAHRRLALLAVLNALVSTPIALFIAWQQATIWALLVIDLVTCTLTLVVLYFWRPIWRPRLVWSAEIMHYFTHFGMRQLASELFQQGMRSLDKLWLGITQGSIALGLYSRAFAFGLTPSRLLIQPIVPVISGVFLQLKDQPEKFSNSIFLILALVIRVGAFIVGCVLVIGPELILLLLGEKWLPILNAFEIMLIAGLFLTLNHVIEHIFLARAQPGYLMKIRGFQLLLLSILLLILTPALGINGAALAFLIANIAGVLTLLLKAAIFSRQRIKQLLLTPIMILLIGYLSIDWLQSQVLLMSQLWLTVVIDLMLFALLFIFLTLMLEKKLAVDLYGFVFQQIKKLKA